MSEASERNNGFKTWCLIELMGHQKIAGNVSEQTIAGASFLRVDVPAKDGTTRFSRFYAPGAVYCINPVSQQIAIGAAIAMDSDPVHAFDLRQLAGQKLVSALPEDEDEDNDEE